MVVCFVLCTQTVILLNNHFNTLSENNNNDKNNKNNNSNKDDNNDNINVTTTTTTTRNSNNINIIKKQLSYKYLHDDTDNTNILFYNMWDNNLKTHKKYRSFIQLSLKWHHHLTKGQRSIRMIYFPVTEPKPLSPSTKPMITSNLINFEILASSNTYTKHTESANQKVQIVFPKDSVRWKAVNLSHKHKYGVKRISILHHQKGKVPCMYQWVYRAPVWHRTIWIHLDISILCIPASIVLRNRHASKWLPSFVCIVSAVHIYVDWWEGNVDLRIWYV